MDLNKSPPSMLSVLLPLEHPYPILNIRFFDPKIDILM